MIQQAPMEADEASICYIFGRFSSILTITKDQAVTTAKCSCRLIKNKMFVLQPILSLV